MEEVPAKPSTNSSASTVGAAPEAAQKIRVQPAVVKKLPVSNNAKMKSILVGLLVIVAGIGTGWVFSGASANTGSDPAPTSNVAENSGNAEVDESMFSDTAVGILLDGGIGGEGTHHLDTGAGEEKYVYLLSTVLDLDSFEGKRVEVQGQTLAAEQAGWLMDVGKIKEVK